MGRILIHGDPHITRPNLPRQSRHKLIQSSPFPAGRYPIAKLCPPLKNVAAWRPPLQGYDLVHTFNEIPCTYRPWIITFEQKIPGSLQGFGQVLKHCLARDNCRRLIAMSDYAKLKMARGLDGSPLLQGILDKTEVIHPSFPARVATAKSWSNPDRLELVFIGRHFARKGGIVALRVAEKAHKLGLPVTVHLVSTLPLQLSSTDHLDADRYNVDLELLTLPNVEFHGSLNNQSVVELLERCHFQLLATLHDSYGYSLIEGFSIATPAIATNICALPELLTHGVNGYQLKLDLDESRQWKQWQHGEDRKSDDYWQVLDRTYDELANQTIQYLTEFQDRSDKGTHYEQLSVGSLHQAQTVHSSEITGRRLDDLYEELIAAG
jgi:glycosyltransferase involved in cell wall biosynthesis